MDLLETRDFDSAGGVYLPAEFLETRRADFGQVIRGFFPYSSRSIIADRGKVRKEEIGPGGFSYAIDDPDREISLLYGHHFDDPIASKQAGNLYIFNDEDGVFFEASLPERLTALQEKAISEIRAKLLGGVSPGFKVPAASALGRQPVELVPESGTGVLIRKVKQAVLYEFSLVQRPVYRSLLWAQKPSLGVKLNAAGTFLAIDKIVALKTATKAAQLTGVKAALGIVGPLAGNLAIGALVARLAYVGVRDATIKVAIPVILGAIVYETGQKLVGDYLGKLREESQTNSRVDALDRRTFDEIVDELMADGMSRADAEIEADAIASNNLATHIRNRREDDLMEFHRWL